MESKKSDERLGERATRNLSEIISALRLGSRSKEIHRFFELFSGGWSQLPLNSPPRWSGVSEDCTPIEFSTVLSAEPSELRLLLEPQARRNTAQGCFDYGIRQLRSLPKDFARRVDLERLEAAIPYFRPKRGPSGDPVWFSFFIAASFWRKKGPLFKVYLNPAARSGFAKARSNLGQFLRSQGVEAAWSELDRVLPPQAQFLFCSLDLTPEEGERIKVYCRVPGASLIDIESWLALAPSYEFGSSTRAIQSLLGEKFSGLKRPPLLVYALGPGERAPRASALQLPVFPHFETDAELQRALLKSARFAKLPLASRNRYLRVCDALSAAQLGSHSLKSGRHYYISFQRRKGTVRWTIYLSPQFYQEQFGRVGLDPEQPWWEQPKGDSETQS